MKQENMVYRAEDFSLENDSLLLDETLFHNANGYLGVRSCFEEGYPAGCRSVRGQYINGFYDLTEMKQAENLCGLTQEKQTMLNVADTQGIELSLGGEPFSMFRGQVLKSSRSLDMKKGVTARCCRWRSPEGGEVEIEIVRMASFALPPLFTIEYRVRSVDFSGRLRFRSSHIGGVMNHSEPDDPRVASEPARYLTPEEAVFSPGGCSVVTAHTSKSGLSVTSAVKNFLSKPAEARRSVRGGSASEEFEVSVLPGETVTLTKYAVFCDSIRRPDDCRAAALAAMEQAEGRPLSEWYRLQEEYLDDFWETGAVGLQGDDRLSLAINYGLYQLIQSVGKDPHANIAAKGLSGEGYEGHYFWDTEMYIEPYFLLTRPEIAKNLIAYRYATLDAARENARILGHKKGALYPWRTIMGKECSGYFPSGSAQYHINGDIAYSVVNYYLVTGDLGFIASCGAEILFETARLWLDVGNYHGGRFQICCVTGPDEYTCLVNNNYYTNAIARHNLRWAARFYDLLKRGGLLAPAASKIGLEETEVAAFREAAEKMYLPYDEKLDISPQDDSFLTKKKWDLAGTPPENFPLLLHYHPLYLYRHQVCKQADTVLAHCILEDEQKLSTMRNSFRYYEQITTHDSSLSSCIFCIMASRFGMAEKAFDYFGDSAEMDLEDTHGNTKDGIHTANMGGVYLAIVFGFAGLRIKEDGLHLAPAIPRQWRAYDFKLRDGGGLLHVSVNGKGAEIVLLSGAQTRIFLYGKAHLLKDRLFVPLEKWGAEE